MTEPPISRRILYVSILITFAIGLWVRLIDLDDPPLDFNPTRQLRSAIIARGLYYERADGVDPEKRDLAISHKQNMERLEPRVLESIAAGIYLIIGDETLWISRVLTSFFWLIGAAALYDLGRRMTSPYPALIGVGIYLFLPFSIRASRSFQPDPGMVMFILLFAWSIYSWIEERSWKWTILSGVFGGLSAFLKPAGFLFCSAMVVSVVLYDIITPKTSSNQKRISFKQFVFPVLKNPQFWTIIGLTAVFASGYYMFGSGEKPSGFSANWTIISQWREIFDPSFYMQWALLVDDLFSISLVAVSFLGILVTSSKNRSLLLGYWAGYLMLGVGFPHHINTHDYYHLPLVGLVSLSIMPLLQLIITKITTSNNLIRFSFVGIVLLFLGYNGWLGRSILIGRDFRRDPAFWRKVSEFIPADSKAVGLTQDYGFRLMYFGWRKIDLWTAGGRIENFADEVGDADYFVITAKNQLNEELANYLAENYQVHAEGLGFLIYDLGSLY